jgi:hypothetical protein
LSESGFKTHDRFEKKTKKLHPKGSKLLYWGLRPPDDRDWWNLEVSGKWRRVVMVTHKK